MTFVKNGKVKCEPVFVAPIPQHMTGDQWANERKKIEAQNKKARNDVIQRMEDAGWTPAK